MPHLKTVKESLKMDFKLILLSVACFAFFIQPAQSGVIIPAIVNTAGDVVSIATNGVLTKGAAMVRGATDIGSILSTGAGLSIRAIARASAAAGEGGANSLIAAGDTIRKLGNTIVGDKLAGTSAANSASPNVSRNARILVEAPVVQKVVENVKQAVEVPDLSIPIRLVQLRVRRPETVVERTASLAVRAPSVFSSLKNAVRSKISSIANIFNFGVFRTAGGPTVYETVVSPRVYERPVVEVLENRK